MKGNMAHCVLQRCFAGKKSAEPVCGAKRPPYEALQSVRWRNSLCSPRLAQRCGGAILMQCGEHSVDSEQGGGISSELGPWKDSNVAGANDAAPRALLTDAIPEQQGKKARSCGRPAPLRVLAPPLSFRSSASRRLGVQSCAHTAWWALGRRAPACGREVRLAG